MVPTQVRPGIPMASVGSVIGPVPSGEHSRADTDREPEDRKHRDIRVLHDVSGWDAVDDQEHDGQEHHEDSNTGKEPPRPQAPLGKDGGKHSKDRNAESNERAARVVESIREIEKRRLSVGEGISDEGPPVLPLGVTLAPDPA